MAKLTHMAEELRRIAGELEAWCAEAREMQHPREATCPHGVTEAQVRKWCRECYPSSPDLRPCPGSDAYSAGDSLPDTIPAPPVRMTYSKVGNAFKARYEKHRQMEWFLPRNTQDCIDIADWIDGQAHRDNREPRAVGKQLLDNFFADPKIREAGYPIAWLAKDPGRFYRPASEDEAPDAAEREKRRYEAHRRHEIAKAESGASKWDCDLRIPEVRAFFAGRGE